MEPVLVVLAAGLGRRYGGDKQIDPVGPSGEMLLEYALFDALRAGFQRIVFVIRRDIEAVLRARIDNALQERAEVLYVYQEEDNPLPKNREKLWGTGHAVLTAAHVVSVPFAAINADDFYGTHAFRALAEHLSRVAAGAYALVGFRLGETLSLTGSVSRGICRVDTRGELIELVEHTDVRWDDARARVLANNDHGRPQTFSGEEVVSVNCWGFTPEIFQQLQERFAAFLQQYGDDGDAEFYITTAVNDIIVQKEATVRVLKSSGAWFGMTRQEDKPGVAERIRALVDQGQYPRSLWE